MVRSFRIVSIALASLAAIALTNTAWAQPGPGGRGPMPGGAFRPSLSMLYGPLLGSPTVQKDLDLIDEQKAKIKEANEKGQAAMQKLFSGMGDMEDLTREERQAKRQEMGKKMQAQMEKNTKAVEGILLPDQLKRLKSIALQVMGVQALNDKDVQKQLKVTDEQVAKLKKVGEDMMKKGRELFSAGAGGDRDAMLKKMQEMRKETEKKMTEVLTADQKTALEKMKGKKLEIPPSELGWPGMGGRRGVGGQSGRGQGGGSGGGERPTD